MSQKLIVYFSYTGNTKQIAEYIRDKLQLDLLALEPIESYSQDYDHVVIQGEDEVNADFRPKLKPLTMALENYDTIILCSPIWWYTLAPVVKSFLGSYDLSQKTIMPVITNGGYGLGRSLEDLRQLCPTAILGRCLEIPFEERQMQLPIQELDRYLLSI